MYVPYATRPFTRAPSSSLGCCTSPSTWTCGPPLRFGPRSRVLRRASRLAGGPREDALGHRRRLDRDPALEHLGARRLHVAVIGRGQRRELDEVARQSQAVV